MKLNLGIALAIVIVFFASFTLLAIFNAAIGQTVATVDTIALICLIVSVFFARKEIWAVISKQIGKNYIIILAALVLFFLIFSIFFLPKTELIFFDENIYQSIGLNILHSWDAQMCWYGTQFVHKCFYTELGFDPGGWPLMLAIAFGIFGPSNAVSYNLELLLGAASIILVFFVSAILTNRKEAGIISAAIFALIPELFIWSKTLANPDLSFMAFATLTTLFFLIFMKKKSKRTLLPVLFSMTFTTYLRVQALLLLPIFAVVFLTLGENGIKDTLKSRVKFVFAKLSDRDLLIMFIVFALLIAPELYVMIATTPELAANAVFYLYPNTKVFSASYILPGIVANVSFLAGLIRNYPLIFLPEIAVFAIIGAAALLLQKGSKNRFAILLMLLCMFFAYFVFFLFYFSGSVLVGVSVRYLLILYPSLSILGALGVLGLGDFIYGLIKPRARKRSAQSDRAGKYMVYSAIILLFFVVPFVFTIPLLRNPSFNYYGFPLNNLTSKIPALNPYTTQYAKNAYDFINDNYELVPTNCLVISETPSVWFMLNRSSGQYAQTDVFTNSSYSNYSCYYLDYGFWCAVSPYNSTVCSFFKSNYKLKLLATHSSGGANNFSLYKILNYTPGNGSVQ